MSFASNEQLFSTLENMFASQYEDYSPEVIEMVIQSINTWCKVKPDNAIVRLVTRKWMESKNGVIPELEELIPFYEIRSCDCIVSLQSDIKKKMLRHFLVQFGRLPRCPEVIATMNYYYLHSRQFPTADELLNTLNRTMELEADPVEFHEKDKELVPTLNLEHIRSTILDYESECHICLETITKGQEVYKLSCDHTFHAKNSDCLDDHNIKHWLSAHKTCPVCRSEVVIKKYATEP